jgi:hypothetical protein
MESQPIPMPVFVELPPFQRYREDYLDDAGYRLLQILLLKNPEAGSVLRNTGGLRKLRFEDQHRGKGKRGGLRVIYYWWAAKRQFWLFTLYDKDEMKDLTPKELSLLKDMLANELRIRQKHP